MTKEIFHDLIHKLVPVNYEKGQIIIKEFSNSKSMLFIEFGHVEVFTTFEGNEFILDNLYSGSIINYRSFFMEDLMFVNFRCKENCQLLELRMTTLNEVMEEHEILKRKLIMY